ncbi:MAG TPA: sugar phosphate nucleotidyltransferase [Fimbriimonadaceae bacterium]|nr:sugar phosphate nucleotidyltransferase [Fimbriimonadaceae bacterium]
MVALIPAAGKGTRMMSMTHGASKELLCVGSKPLLDRVLEEAFAAGVDEAVVISSPQKVDLEEHLQAKRDPRMRVVHQVEQRGLAHALWHARPFTAPALVLLPDTVFATQGPGPALASALSGGADGAVATELVDDADVHRYGILEVVEGRVERILEKPSPLATQSRVGVAGRYGLGLRMLAVLEEAVEEFAGEGEIDLTSVLNRGISAGLRVQPVPLEPGVERVDCGTPSGYLRALELFG